MNETENVFETSQRGTTLVGFIGGLVLGLAIAVAVALFITNAPVPFVNKVRPASENVNPAGSGPLPDPNKPLYTHAPTKAVAPEPPKIDPATDPKAAPPPAEKGNVFPAEDSRFLLQAGAFRTPDDADSMRAGWRCWASMPACSRASRTARRCIAYGWDPMETSKMSTAFARRWRKTASTFNLFG